MSNNKIGAITILIVFLLGFFSGFAVVNNWSTGYKVGLYIMDAILAFLVLVNLTVLDRYSK